MRVLLIDDHPLFREGLKGLLLGLEPSVQVEQAGSVDAAEALQGQAFDLVLMSYLQLPPEERDTVLRRAAAATTPGGTLLLVGHDLRNIPDGHGGPKDPSLLWTTTEVVVGSAVVVVVVVSTVVVVVSLVVVVVD